MVYYILFDSLPWDFALLKWIFTNIPVSPTYMECVGCGAGLHEALLFPIYWHL